MKISQFDVLLVNFSPTKGSELRGERPCVVLETNGFRNQGSVTIVTPLTTQLKKVFSIETVIEPTKKNGLKEESKLMLRQLRVIDKARIIKKLGQLEEKHHDKILFSIEALFDLRKDFTG